MIALTDKIAFYVPSTTHTDRPITPKEHKRRAEVIAMAFSDLFGGATIIKGAGAYVTNAGALVTESIMIVSSYTDHDTSTQKAPEVIAMATHYCTLWHQEVIALEYGDRMLFVSPEEHQDQEEHPAPAPAHTRHQEGAYN